MNDVEIFTDSDTQIFAETEIEVSGEVFTETDEVQPFEESEIQID